MAWDVESLKEHVDQRFADAEKQAHSATREMTAPQFAAIEERVRHIEARIDAEGGGGINAAWIYLVGALAALSPVVSLVVGLVR